MASQDMQATASSSNAQNAASPMDAVPAAQPQTTIVDEATKKDRALAEFMLMLDDNEPLVCHTVMSSLCYRVLIRVCRYRTRSQTTTYSE